MAANLRERQSLSKSPATIERYWSIYRSLEKRAAKETSKPGTPVAAIQIARLFLRYEATWQAATARVYRAAIVYAFEQLEDEGDSAIPSARSVLLAEHPDEVTARRLQEQFREKRREAKRRSPRTASQKVKRFSKRDSKKLLEEFSGRVANGGV